MASDNFFRNIVVVFGIVVTAAMAFWNKIMDWSGKVLFPWLDQNFHEISDLAKQALIWVDNHVAVPIRNAVKQAWKKLREYLLKWAVHFERHSSNEWVRRWSGYIIKRFENGRVAPVRVEAEEIVSWDELPPDVRQEWLKKGMPNQEVNVTELRDQELEMEMTH